VLLAQSMNQLRRNSASSNNQLQDEESQMASNDDDTRTCRIDVLIEEHEERTRAKAQLSWAGKKFVGIGLARLDPQDEPVARIGDELAIARALSDLANQLFALTSTDIQASTHEPVTDLHH
jgi:Rv2632c-like